MFKIVTEECESVATLGDVAVCTRTETKLISPTRVKRADVEAWVKRVATAPDEEGGEWTMDDEPVGYRFHHTLETLTRDVVECLPYYGVTVE